ncbi:DUF1681-domain-containing protein [Coccomyxa subellipsoidea C-169]|uniref:DUF1681-domain-containing protein n=1 Tax=Coccomyxa subellipsoidea (strain C-169) TaxID=574566 RepID=I0YN28_COCSC|nr:DUF1681-domain-containing protein [Coccomyxa subellipsoidea C-169]EIE19797.1 DUF1681-domain-containing protein [Coccomyxa subellipsoidea C-169]|eukprot:XP_005644341.1 DUF1681-domain-containing protein [Coccomyxa subellipsoidea C-169]
MLKGQLSSLHSRHSQQLASLKAKVAEQEKQATEMQTQYKTALGTMLRKAFDPKTGKVIPAATITDLEQSLAMKEHAADTARFRVLHLRAKLQRVQDSQRENGMKRSLHVVDFEHLKMENAMLMNKIEVRGKQLLEAQQQSQAAVHVLAHVKQKLHLEERRRAELEATLAVAQEKLRERKERGRLLKRQREKRRLRKIKMQEAELFEDPTLLAHFQDVTSSVVTSGDDCWIRLHDVTTGDMFAECPIMKGKPLTSSVEPVVDSSRYFVLRVVDRDSGRHAFIGFGFRERAHASDFAAALSDYQQYLKRSEEAAAMQQAFAAAESGEQGPDLPTLDFSLKPGETVSLKLSAKGPAARGSFLGERMVAMPTAEASPSESGAAMLLAPPPAATAQPQAAAQTVSGPLNSPSNSAVEAEQKITAKPDSEGDEKGDLSRADGPNERTPAEDSSIDEEFGSFVG